MSTPLFLLSVFASILAMVAGAGYLWLRRSPAARTSATDNPSEPWADTLQMVGEKLPAAPERGERHRDLLAQAGYRQPEAPQILRGLKILLPILFTSIAAALAFLRHQHGFELLTAVMAAAGIGYLAPEFLLRALIRRRASNLLHGLPTALELIILSLEGGQSLDAALLDAAGSLRNSHPAIADEIASIPVQAVSGRSRQESLRNLIGRTPEPEVKRFAQVLLDSDRFGTALASTLRNHLRYLRTKLRQTAQEQARKVGVKLVFPVFFLIFPAVLLVTLGPALLQLMSALDTQLGSLK